MTSSHGISWTFWQTPRVIEGQSYDWGFLLKVDLVAIFVLLAFFALPPIRDWTGCDLRIIAAGFFIHFAYGVALKWIGLHRVNPRAREFLSHLVNLVAVVSIPLSSEKALFALWLLYPLIVWMDGYGSPKSVASLLTSAALPWADPLWHWGSAVAADKAALAGVSVVAGAVIYLVSSYFTSWTLQEAARKSEEGRRRAMEAERERIGRSLHGTLGAALSEISLWHEVALAGAGSGTVSDDDPLTRAQARARTALTELRALVAGLDGEDTEGGRSVAAADLVAGVRRQIDGLCAAAGVRLDLRADDSGSVAPNTAYHIAKIMVEATTNAVRHARPTRIDITVSLSSPLRLEVSDDGIGFDPGATAHGRGLRSLREHAEAMAATLALDAAPGRGTRVLVGRVLAEETRA